MWCFNIPSVIKFTLAKSKSSKKCAFQCRKAMCYLQDISQQKRFIYFKVYYLLCDLYQDGDWRVGAGF